MTTKTTKARAQRVSRSKSPVINDAQRLLLSRYKGGAFQHIASLARTRSHFEVELQRCGDPVLEALLGYLSDQQGCVGAESALRKLRFLACFRRFIQRLFSCNSSHA